MRAVIQPVNAILSAPSTETLTSQYGKIAIPDAMRDILYKFRNLIQETNSVETTAYSISNPFDNSNVPIPKIGNIKLSFTLGSVHILSPNAKAN